MADSLEMHKCAGCNWVKGQKHFSKKQWNLRGQGGLCMPCWESHHDRIQEQQGSNKKQKVVDEQTCLFCEETFVVTEKKSKSSQMAKECNSCAKQRELQERQRFMNAKRDYYLTYGVGYETPMFSTRDDIRLKREINVSVGTYELVYYSSVDHGGDQEDIHRTARGTLMLSDEEWDGKPALHGQYMVYPSLTNGEACEDYRWQIPRIPYGLSGAFIEHVTDWDPSQAIFSGSNIFDYTRGKEGTKQFILIRGEFVTDEFAGGEFGADGKWFSDLHKMTEDDYVYYNAEPCCAILNVIDKPIALGLYPDRLYGNKYDPNGATAHDVFDAENGQERADTLTARYRDASASWVCKHLGVPDEIAFRIREYVTPAPVFYLREGDLVLTVKDSWEYDGYRVLVFRKSSTS